MTCSYPREEETEGEGEARLRSNLSCFGDLLLAGPSPPAPLSSKHLVVSYQARASPSWDHPPWKTAPLCPSIERWHPAGPSQPWIGPTVLPDWTTYHLWADLSFLYRFRSWSVNVGCLYWTPLLIRYQKKLCRRFFLDRTKGCLP